MSRDTGAKGGVKGGEAGVAEGGACRKMDLPKPASTTQLRPAVAVQAQDQSGDFCSSTSLSRALAEAAALGEFPDHFFISPTNLDTIDGPS